MFIGNAVVIIKRSGRQAFTCERIQNRNRMIRMTLEWKSLWRLGEKGIMTLPKWVSQQRLGLQFQSGWVLRNIICIFDLKLDQPQLQTDSGTAKIISLTVDRWHQEHISIANMQSSSADISHFGNIQSVRVCVYVSAVHRMPWLSSIPTLHNTEKHCIRHTATPHTTYAETFFE